MSNALKILNDIFGYSGFRDGQDIIVDAIVSGEDVLAIMPTGGGKSICYQVPALARSGLAVIVSPLVSLMKDQVDALVQNGVSATFINSSLDNEEVRARVRGMLDGQYKLLYIAPERMGNAWFIDLLVETNLSFFAIDEAHCISQWGHDFRPSYARIAEKIDLISSVKGRRIQRVALTATATDVVRKDIIDQLKLVSHREFIHGFDRKNLSFIVKKSSEKNKDLVIELRAREDQSVIVYCPTVRRVKDVSRFLKDEGFAVGSYHGKLPSAMKNKVQEDFVNDELKIIVATNAFGMGIDKPDVRAVVHYDMPGSIEAYYQEAGRAGRDGEHSDCVMLYSKKDSSIHNFFLEAGYPSREVVEAFLNFLVNLSLEEPVFKIDKVFIEKSTAGVVKGHMIDSLLTFLLDQGVIESVRNTDVKDDFAAQWRIKDAFKTPAYSKIATRRKVAQSNLNSMIAFCTTTHCRKSFILNYFNEKSSITNCGACDICLGLNKQLKSAARSRPTDKAEIAKKVVLCVKDAGQNIRMHYLIGILLGVRDRSLVTCGYDLIESFGVLGTWERQKVVALLRALVNKGYLCEKSSESKELYVGAKGEALIQGLEYCSSPSPEYADRLKKNLVGEEVAGVNNSRAGLGSRMVKLRAAIAKNERVPPFMIWGESTMRDLVIKKPKDKSGLEGVIGLGRAKIDRFGDYIIREINRGLEDSEIE